MDPVSEWSVARLMLALEPVGFDLVCSWGEPETWTPELWRDLREAVHFRATTKKVCECGRAKQMVSRECRWCYAVTRAAKARICVSCGKSFKFQEKNRKNRKTCSDACHQAQVSTSWFKNRTSDTDRQQRLRERRRRASAKRQARGWKPEKGRWRRICERDNWTCWICHEAIDPTIEGWGQRWAGTADHIVALAHGGSDEDDNLQAAHKTCNIRRWHAPKAKLAGPSMATV